MTESFHLAERTGEQPLVNKILLVIESPPHENSRAAEGFRMATAMIAMDLLPQVLFVDNGVYWLVKNQTPKAAGLAAFKERLKTISDLIGVHVLSDSLAKRKLSQDDLDGNYHSKNLSLHEASQLFEQHEAVMAF